VSERARKEGRGYLGRVKCYRSERVRRSGDSSAAPRERLAGRAVDTRSEISGKKKSSRCGRGRLPQRVRGWWRTRREEERTLYARDSLRWWRRGACVCVTLRSLAPLRAKQLALSFSNL